MAATVARLEAVLSADTRRFDSAMDRSHTRMGSLGKAAGIMGGAIFLGLGIVAKKGFSELMDSQKVMAQTEAGLKSTGGAANVTAEGITNLSNRLSKLSGVDDEVIQAGANLLLTFRKVHNEVGRGNQIFDRATEAGLDLAARGFGTPESNAKMLGKALEDPIKGMTAMRRAGVTFTQSQQDVIKALVESGDLLGAQKVILGEVEKQVGGSAKAYGDTLPGQIAKAKNAFDEVAATMSEKLLPPLTTVLEKVVDFIDFLSAHPKFATAFVAGLTAIAAAMIAVSIATTIATAAASPWILAVGAITAAVALLVVGLIIAWKKSETFREIVTGVFNAVKAAVAFAIGLILKQVDLFLAGLQLLAEAASHLPFVGDKFKGIADKIGDARAQLQDLNKEINGTKGKDVPINLIVTVNGQRVAGRGGADGILGTEAYNWAVANPAALAPPMASPTGAAAGLKPMILDELALGRAMGLRLMSGYRPGAITSTGRPSLHGVGQAIDMVGSDAQMRAFAYAAYRRPGIQEVIYSPIGWSHFGSGFSSITSPSVLRDHYSHVHVGAASGGDGVLGLQSYDRGGWLPRGLSLAYNGTGRPERVGGGDVIINMPNYLGSKQELLSWLRNAAQQFKNQNGRTAFG